METKRHPAKTLEHRNRGKTAMGYHNSGSYDGNQSTFDKSSTILFEPSTSKKGILLPQL